MNAAPATSAPSGRGHASPQKIASWVEAGQGRRLQAAIASSNSRSSSQRRRSRSSRSSAMWAGGPPKPRHPSRPQARATVVRATSSRPPPVAEPYTRAVVGGALLTTVVGSYPQPAWLIDRDRLGERLPPRVAGARALACAGGVPRGGTRRRDPPGRLDQERAGVDVITDGEMRRESYSNRFATALDDSISTAPVSRSTAPATRTLCRASSVRSAAPRPVEVRDVEFLRSLTSRRIKITVPGPFDDAAGAGRPLRRRAQPGLAYAGVNEELRDLKAAGADVVQIDEPYLQARPEAARRYAWRRSTARSPVSTARPCCTCFGYAHVVHDKPTGYPFLRELNDCTATRLLRGGAAEPRARAAALPDKTIVLGVLDLGASEVESADLVTERIRSAIEVVPPERRRRPGLRDEVPAAQLAFGKLCAMVAGARQA